MQIWFAFVMNQMGVFEFIMISHIVCVVIGLCCLDTKSALQAIVLANCNFICHIIYIFLPLLLTIKSAYLSNHMPDKVCMVLYIHSSQSLTVHVLWYYLSTPKLQRSW